jgi:hypothetical protein
LRVACTAYLPGEKCYIFMEMQPSQEYFYRKENPFGLKEYIDNIKDNRTVSESTVF